MANALRISQRTNIQFYVKLGKTQAETLKLLQQAHGDMAMAKSNVYEWHRRFSAGKESVSDSSRSGRPHEATSTVALTPREVHRLQGRLLRKDVKPL